MPTLIATLLVVFICSSATFAELSEDSTAITPTSISSSDKTIPPGQTDSEIYRKLKDVFDGTHHLQQTLHEIIFEVTRQDYALASEPNVIGPMVIPAIPAPTGAIPMGIFFPPRKKYMTFYAEQMHDLLIMLAEESASLSDNVENDVILNNQINSIKKHLENLKSKNDTLQHLMTGSSYNNLLIGEQAVQMSAEVDQMKKLLKDSEKEIHKDLRPTAK